MQQRRSSVVLPLLSFFLTVSFLGTGPARAAGPSLLADIAPSGERGADVVGLGGAALSLGRVALIQVEEPSSGRELWVTDGTENGTRPLLDFCPGTCSSRFVFLGNLGGVGIFYQASEARPRRLWRSDGTVAGTFPLDSGDQRVEPCNLSAEVAGSRLFFAAGSNPECDLWTTDGTLAGTVQLQPDSLTIVVDSFLDPIAVVGQHVFFIAFSTDGNSGPQLWRSAGTPESTVQIRSWATPPPPELLTAAGSRLFFIGWEPEIGRELWASDGTPDGTRKITNFAAPSPFDFSNFQVIDGILYFHADDGAGIELWRSDGTAAGTWRITTFGSADPFDGLHNTWTLEKIGDRLLFLADNDGSGLRWWTTAGDLASTAPLSGCPGGCPVYDPRAQPVRLGGKIVFPGRSGASGTEIWATDGTGAGTRVMRDLCPGNCGIELWSLGTLLGKAFFIAGVNDQDTLWVSDGTPDGTRSLLPLGLSPPDYGTNTAPSVALAELPGRALIALGGQPASVMQLWRTNGTREGTQKIQLSPVFGGGSNPQSFVSAGSGVRFLLERQSSLWSSQGTAATTTSLDIPFPGESLISLGPVTLLHSSSFPLWRSDGTPAGTFQLTSDVTAGPPVSLGSRAVFFSWAGGLQYELWATDGTVASLQKLADVEGATGLQALSVEAFFADSSDRLWVTDGTPAGTRPLTSAGTVEIGSPLRVARLGAVVFFVGRQSLGEVLWRTDGTAAGTHALAVDRLGRPMELLAHGGRLYAISDSGRELWTSDGTETGTILLKTFSSSDLSEERYELTALGPLVFFIAKSEAGRELWRTDGTPAGTVIVRDITPGGVSSSPSDLTVLGNQVYFSAFEPKHGKELWESDGTAAGTRLVQDIAPGAVSSFPQELTAAGGRLYFSADDQIHGREPWAYAPGGARCVPSDFVLCLGGGQFKVEADWRDFEDRSGRGRAVSLTADTGYFWFFDAANVEVILKTLDGRGINGHHWVFYGALSSVEYTLTVTDTETGAARRYINPVRRLASVADTQAFGPLGASAPESITLGLAPERAGEAIVSSRISAGFGFEKATCAPSSTRLCLNNGRFAVEARWKAQGNNGIGQAVPLPGGDTGYFWFFNASNVEVVLKVLDGRPLNGKFWVFYGALSNVEYTLTVTDTATGTVKTYTNPNGRLASVADTGAF